MAGKRARAVAIAAGAALLGLTGCEQAMRLGPQVAGQPTAIAGASTRTGGTTDPLVGSSDFTVDLWVKAGKAATSEEPCSSSTGSALVASSTRSGIYGATATHLANRWSLSMAADGDLAFAAQAEPVALTPAPPIADPVCADLPGAGVRDGAWHHVAAQRGLDGAVTIWVDGKQAGSGTSGAGALDRVAPSAPFSADTTISLVGGPYEVRVIDEVRLSRGFRYTRTFTPPTSPARTDDRTLGLWHLDEIVRRQDRDVTPDASGQAPAHDLVLTLPIPAGTDDGLVGDSPFIR